MSKTKNPNSKYWDNKCMGVWRDLVRMLHDYTCPLNGFDKDDECKGPLQAHHIITKRRRATRHDPRNGLLVCSKHHTFSTVRSPHGGPAGFFAWFRRAMPERHIWIQDNLHKEWDKKILTFENSYSQLLELRKWTEDIGIKEVWKHLLTEQKNSHNSLDNNE